MPVRKTLFAEGEYYHVYNRGNSKQPIFLDEQDYKRFVQYLYVCNSQKSFNFRDDVRTAQIDAFDFERGQQLVSIGAWVLMPNHFHLYITVPPKPGLGEENRITKYIQKLGTSYAKYFNAKYKRTGSLFEGVFKSVHIENDVQAQYLFSYIHLNPIKIIDPTWKEKGIQNIQQAITFLKNYQWSSYLDYCQYNRSEVKIITPTDFPYYFQNINDVNKELLSWLTQASDLP